jgi:hypothetical protein
MVVGPVRNLRRSQHDRPEQVDPLGIVGSFVPGAWRVVCSTFFGRSIPSHLLAEFKRSSDVLIRSEEVLSQYRNLAEFHVPHGQRHISELSHMLLGAAIAHAIQGVVAPGKVADGSTATWSAERPEADGLVVGRTSEIAQP